MKAEVKIPKGYKQLKLGDRVKAGDYGINSWCYKPAWWLFASDAGRVRKDEIFIRPLKKKARKSK